MSNKLDQLAEEYVKQMSATEVEVRSYFKQLAHEHFRAGYLARDKELRDAWPSDEVINSWARLEALHPKDWIEACDWLKARVLGST